MVNHKCDWLFQSIKKVSCRGRKKLKGNLSKYCICDSHWSPSYDKCGLLETVSISPWHINSTWSTVQVVHTEGKDYSHYLLEFGNTKPSVRAPQTSITLLRSSSPHDLTNHVRGPLYHLPLFANTNTDMENEG